MNKIFTLNSLYFAVLAIFAAVVARPALAADASNGQQLAERAAQRGKGRSCHGGDRTSKMRESSIH